MIIARDKSTVLLGLIIGLWLAYVFLKLAAANIFFPGTGLSNKVVGESPSKSWRQYCYQQDGFCAKFPSTPRIQQGYQSSSYGVSNGPVFSTGVIIQKEIDPSITVEQLYEDAILQASPSSTTKVESSKQVTIDGQPAKRVEISDSYSGAEERNSVVMIVKGDKLYVLQSQTRVSEPLDTEGFFNSFTFTR